MSEETTNKFCLVDLPNLPPSVDKAFQNLTEKPTKNAGETFGDIWYLVFGGLSHLADKRKLRYAAELEKYKAELDESISSIPPEKKVEPSIQVTAQALENSKYCVEEPELRKMFSALISNSMNCDYAEDIHPSFAEMIKQMSPLDGQILKVFKNGPSNGFPICAYHLSKENGGYRVLAENIFLEIQIEDPFESSKSLTSLSRFGLLSIPSGIYLNNPELYKKFEEHPLYHFFKEHYHNGTVTIEKMKANLTPLGKSFVRSCIPD